MPKRKPKVKPGRFLSKIPNLGRDAPRRVRRGGELSHAEAQRAQRWRIETSLPLSPAGCGRGIVAAWSSGRRFPSRFRPRGGNAASGTRRPRRAAPTQGQGRGSPRRASWPTSPERACGSRPRGARGRIVAGAADFRLYHNAPRRCQRRAFKGGGGRQGGNGYFPARIYRSSVSTSGRMRMLRK